MDFGSQVCYRFQLEGEINRRNSAQTKEISMYVDVRGKGPDTVLIHGLGATHYSWRDTVEALETSSTTHAVDLPGFGQSDRRTGFTMEQRAKDVLAYVEANDLTNIRLVGHSMGGGVCCYMVNALRGQTAIHIERLVLIGAVAFAPGPSDFDIPTQESPIETAATDEQLQGWIPMPPGTVEKAGQLLGWVPSRPEVTAYWLLKQGYHDDSKITAGQVTTYAKNFSIPDGMISLIGHAAHLGDIKGFDANYPDFDVPTLVVWGEKDPILPLDEFGRPLDDILPDSDLKIIPNCGHTPHEECPTETIPAIVDFLS
jgi:pimeloyl-ACP methyl ester carboxylesterase